MARSRRSRERLSAAEARRVALAAQGFADARPARPDGRALRRVLKRVGLLQIDSVNVLARGHYLTLFGRLGPYPLELVDHAAWYAPRRLFEYWGHEASLLPVATQPLLRWRMQRAHDDAWGGMRRVAQDRPELVERVLAEVTERGPMAASEMEEEGPRRSEPWWNWSDAKRAFEFLFWSGRSRATAFMLPQASSRARRMRQRSNGCVSTGSSEASWPQYSNSRRGAYQAALSTSSSGYGPSRPNRVR